MIQFVENLAINSTNHVVRRYAIIRSSKSVTLQQLNPKTKLAKSKNFQSSLSFTIDIYGSNPKTRLNWPNGVDRLRSTLLLFISLFVFLSGVMIASSQLSSLLIYSDCWVHPGFKLTKKTKTLKKRLQDNNNSR